MGVINNLETRFRGLAFPSLLRGIAIIHFIMVIVLMLRPGVGHLMTFDWAQIMGGEVWRIFSFLLLPVDLVPIEHIENVQFDPIQALFAFFMMRIAFMCGDALEHAWGVWRTSVYFYGVMVGQVIANVLLSVLGFWAIPEGGFYIYLAAFFAFSTLFPKQTLMLMLLIPVQIWILAVLAGLGVVAAALGSISYGVFTLFTFAPYLWWALPVFLKLGKQRSDVTKRRIDFQAKTKAKDSATFHLCSKCEATEASHPDREFRVGADDEEVCSACLED